MMAGIRTWGCMCEARDGSGERDWLEGGRCYECGGTGLEPDDDEYGPDDPDFWETFYEGVDLSPQEDAGVDDRRAFRGDRITPAGSQDEPPSLGAHPPTGRDGTGDDDE